MEPTNTRPPDPTDSNGDVQPVDEPRNWQGMGNNLAQQVPVTVR